MTSFAAPIAEQIWDKKYRLKGNDGTPVDQTVEDTWRRIAWALAEPESSIPDGPHQPLSQTPQEYWAGEFYDALEDFKFLPAGRITAGAGTGRAVTLFNCFVMGTIPDSMDGIFSMLREAALTMQQGGGIGYDFTPIRPKGALVEKLGADASGPLTFMDCWDAMCRTVMSAGSRRGAMMGTMRCDHPDIFDFIEAKGDAARLRMFNLSVLVTDAFMQAVDDNANWDLIHKKPPARVENPPQVYEGPPEAKGEFLGYVHRTVKARDLWNKIMESTYAYAEPGVIFIDRINQNNNLSYVEEISATNPCGEQPLPPYGACLLGSINLARLVENAFEPNAGIDGIKLGRLVATAVRMMDNVIDVSNFPLTEQADEARDKRRIGLGVTGLADALAMVGLTYGTEAAATRTEAWLRMVAIAAYKASVDLAKEKGAFPLFDADAFVSGEHHVTNMPEELIAEIREHGIRNALLTSIAPTGTISLYAGNVSSGIEPAFAHSYTRKVLENDGSHSSETVESYAVARYREWWLVNNNPAIQQHEEFDPEVHLPEQFVTAQDLDPKAHVAMQAAAQKWIDSSISKTINLPEDISFADFKNVYWNAYESGCKGCTTYRPNEVTGSVLSVDEKPKKQPWHGIVGDVLVEIEGQQNMIAAVDYFSATPYPDDSDLISYHMKVRSVEVESEKPDMLEVEANACEWDAEAAEEHYSETLTEEDKARSKAYLKEMLSKAKGHVMTEEESTAQAKSFAAANLALDKAETVPALELPHRPQALNGTTYKIKVGEGKAVYLTISDINENGRLRPFEIFLRSSDPTHDEWMVALARMVSAILRRPLPADFVPEELMRIHSAKTGGFWPGHGYQPSLVAAIGRQLKEHMDARAAVSQYRESFEHNTPAELRKHIDFPGVVSPKEVYDRVQRRVFGPHETENVAWPEHATQSETDATGPSCTNCHSYNVHVLSGCLTCADCGESKCG